MLRVACGVSLWKREGRKEKGGGGQGERRKRGRRKQGVGRKGGRKGGGREKVERKGEKGGRGERRKREGEKKREGRGGRGERWKGPAPPGAKGGGHLTPRLASLPTETEGELQRRCTPTWCVTEATRNHAALARPCCSVWAFYKRLVVASAAPSSQTLRDRGNPCRLTGRNPCHVGATFLGSKCFCWDTTTFLYAEAFFVGIQEFFC